MKDEILDNLALDMCIADIMNIASKFNSCPHIKIFYDAF